MKEERKKNPIIFICRSHQVQRKMQTGETAAVNSLYFLWKIVYLFIACRNYLFEKIYISFQHDLNPERQDRGGGGIPGVIERVFALNQRHLGRSGPTGRLYGEDRGVLSTFLLCDQGPGAVPI